MVKRINKNKVRCENCGKVLNGTASIHTKCVDDYVKTVLNKSIIVTCFDRIKKPISYLFFSIFIFLLLISMINAGTFFYNLFDNKTVEGFYNSSENYIITGGLNKYIENLSVSVLDGYLEFDGINDNIVVSNGKLITKNLTVSYWIKIFPNEGGYPLSDYRGYQFYIRAGSAYAMRFVVNNGTNTFVQVTNNEFADNSWHNIMMTYNGTGITAYIDNVFKGSTPLTGNIDYDLSRDFSIGRLDSGGGSYQNFSIDELRIYNQSLTNSQLTEIYNSGRISNKSLITDDLVLWYNFDENNGSIVYDKSGNNYDGN